MTGNDESLYPRTIDLRIVLWKVRDIIGRGRRRRCRRNRCGCSRLGPQYSASAEKARHRDAAVYEKLFARQRCIHERDLKSRPSDILVEYCYFPRPPLHDCSATRAATFRSACETTH